MTNKFKRLAIISDCIHTKDANGNVATENHIYCRQMQVLAAAFEETLIVCPFVPPASNNVVSVYTQKNIQFLELKNAGGSSFAAKLNLCKMLPGWLRAFKKANGFADIIYLRMPANLCIPAFFYFKLKGKKTFATYTGTWNDYATEPATYRFQKRLLTNFFKGPVWVYSAEDTKHTHLIPGISPSYSNAEWDEETAQVAERIISYNTSVIDKLVFITVGALVPNKNQQYILNTCVQLKKTGVDFYWYIVGDGYLKETYEQFVRENDLEKYVCIAGKKNYKELRALYRGSNFLVQATIAEGFGKAPVEGMFHGVIPLLSNTAMAAEMTGNGKRGVVFNIGDANSLYEIIVSLTAQKLNWSAMVTAGRDYVKTFTLEHWAEMYISKINEIN